MKPGTPVKIRELDSSWSVWCRVLFSGLSGVVMYTRADDVLVRFDSPVTDDRRGRVMSWGFSASDLEITTKGPTT